MTYLVDSNIVIHLRDGVETVLRKFETHKSRVAMSALALVELQRGLYKNPMLTAARLPRLQTILQHIPILSFDAAAAEAYGRIIMQIGWTKGRDYDRMIAAHAISTRSILVTDNVKDFKDVPGVQLENWNAG